MILRIVSGGQTGADQGGLVVARAYGVQTGGWAPRGWRTDDGPAPWLADYGLREASGGYRERTALNVRDSHGTLVVGDQVSPGSRLTATYARHYGRPILRVVYRFDRDDSPTVDVFAQQLAQWALMRGIETLNVAGNRERTNPGVSLWTQGVVGGALELLGATKTTETR